MELKVGRGKVLAGAKQRLVARLGDGIDQQVEQIERAFQNMLSYIVAQRIGDICHAYERRCAGSHR